MTDHLSTARVVVATTPTAIVTGMQRKRIVCARGLVQLSRVKIVHLRIWVADHIQNWEASVRVRSSFESYCTGISGR